MKITIEILAEKLSGKLWIKGDVKRIYLDCGYNTKKMSTKTYVYQREDGTYGVSCYIECPSQPFEWIKSQQQEIIEGVNESIEKAIFEINNPDVDYDEHQESKRIAVEIKEEKTEFEINIERYYSRSIERNQEIINQKAAFESLTDDDKIQIENIKSEMALILGTQGSAKRSKELKNMLSLYASQPSELSDWMKQAITFTNVDEYVKFKLEQRMQKYSSI